MKQAATVQPCDRAYSAVQQPVQGLSFTLSVAQAGVLKIQCTSQTKGVASTVMGMCSCREEGIWSRREVRTQQKRKRQILIILQSDHIIQNIIAWSKQDLSN